MNRIKQRRTQLGLTQKELAEKMKTTQQTIARWENGKATPSIGSYRDLAYVLGTSLNSLIGLSFTVAQSSSYQDWINARQVAKGTGDDISGFWGHLGILGSNRESSIWYPITEDAMNDSYRGLQDCRVFAVPCLNNKLVVVNPQNIKRGVVLDDACDSYDGDWEINWYDTGDYPLEIFAAIERVIDIDEGSSEWDPEEISEELLKKAKAIIKTENLSYEDICRLTKQIRIVYEDGRDEYLDVYDYSKPASKIYNILFSEEENPKFMLVTDSNEADIFITLKNITLMEFPLHKIEEELTIQNIEFFQEEKSDDLV